MIDYMQWSGALELIANRIGELDDAALLAAVDAVSAAMIFPGAPEIGGLLDALGLAPGSDLSLTRNLERDPERVDHLHMIGDWLLREVGWRFYAARKREIAALAAASCAGSA
ncbi:hypothetical protein [Acidiphilium acidophilum]|uniref:Uncharacterized protein n=1 Tax=Acidiphilium acidophilum TaxID=76588 RepID=A0AAW9DSG5_ACIAO|nr:hypothetical protein [Acidiphilium acidophilum]MDX5931576.1 hypothetical protein [Acidiphilium acidophilum]